MLSPGVCWDWRMSWYAVSNWQWMWSGVVESGSLCMTNRPAILKWYLVGLDGDGN